jgi:UDP-glucuronate 4-epimerase
MTILVTGAAGFIGMHVCQLLLERGDSIVGIDSLNDYYDVGLKKARLARLSDRKGFVFEQVDVSSMTSLADLFARHQIDQVVHLAAQAGVRYSITDPHVYGSSNLVGFLNVLEACRHFNVGHLVYASSSSVYGGNCKMPFSESDAVDHPVSLYAATKKANELMAHSYSHLYALPTTGLRFFTVYGPWGRPDMSPVLFARAIFEGRPIDVFNHGKMQRDFTYIDDIVEGVVRVLDKPATSNVSYDALNPDPATSSAPWRVFNIGNHQPVELLDYIALLEQAIGKPAIKNFKPLQPGDVLATYADTQALRSWSGFAPATPLASGLGKFAEWVRQYYNYS